MAADLVVVDCCCCPSAGRRCHTAKGLGVVRAHVFQPLSRMSRCVRRVSSSRLLIQERAVFSGSARSRKIFFNGRIR